MSAEKPNPSMRISGGFDSSSSIAGYKMEDFLVAILPPSVGVAFAQETGLEQLVPYFVVGGGLLGALLVFLAPDHLTAKDWIGILAADLQQPSEIAHVSDNRNQAREQKHFPKTRVYEMSQRTQDLTHVEQVHKHANAVERADGTVVSAIKVNPANMALASETKWEQMTSQWEGYINDVVDYRIQIFATMKHFQLDEYLNQLKKRKTQPDIRDRPVLRENINDFLSWYPEYLSWYGTNQRQYYIIIPVAPEEVHSAEKQEKGALEKLSEVRFVGSLFGKFMDLKSGKSDAEIKRDQFRELDKRVKTAKNTGIGQLQGCSAQTVSGVEMATLIKEYWDGREFDVSENQIRTHPVVMRGSSDE